MVFLLKALLGIGAFGGGVVAPIALSQQTNTVIERKEGSIARELGSTLGKTISNFGNALFEVRAREASHQKISKALGQVANCKLLQNPENPEHWLNALYACNENSKGEVEFKYVSARNDFVTRAEDGFVKKVSTVNYVEEGVDTSKTAKLELTFENGSKKDWKVAVDSGWKHFSNVNLSKQCTISSKGAGGNDLRCVLQGWEGKENSHSVYRFSIF